GTGAAVRVDVVAIVTGFARVQVAVTAARRRGHAHVGRADGAQAVARAVAARADAALGAGGTAAVDAGLIALPVAGRAPRLRAGAHVVRAHVARAVAGDVAGLAVLTGRAATAAVLVGLVAVPHVVVAQLRLGQRLADAVRADVAGAVAGERA